MKTYFPRKDDRMIATAKLNPKDPLGLAKKPHPKRHSNGKSDKKGKKVFRYGNYSQYYGYRLKNDQLDARAESIEPALINNRRILDIGCNTGQLTLLLATKNQPKYVVGVDIDGKLIEIAKKNKKYYSPFGILSSLFPKSIQQTYGPLPSIDPQQNLRVFFQEMNFLDSEFEKESFDTVMALSITKWIQLNWGDEGLLKFFQKCYDVLAPEGCLLLECQSFESYRKKRNIHPEIKKNYDAIKIKPDKFREILIEKIKFSKVVDLSDGSATDGDNTGKEFRRPFYLVYK